MAIFKKILIADDVDAVNFSLIEVLEAVGIVDIDQAGYCDEALLKLKKALFDQKPFELLISDLSFLPDHRDQKIKSGEELIKLAKLLQPSIKVIAYSIEDKPFVIKTLFEKHNIDGFVQKGRKSIEQLKTAIESISLQDKKYLSPELSHVLKDQTINEIDKNDIKIIELLAEGLNQDEIVLRFKELNLIPNSKSTIEKKISKLKDYFKTESNIQLVLIAKDLGLLQ
jgi:two-component system capsular synthesis response regulator RcsB